MYANVNQVYENVECHWKKQILGRFTNNALKIRDENNIYYARLGDTETWGSITMAC